MPFRSVRNSRSSLYRYKLLFVLLAAFGLSTGAAAALPSHSVSLTSDTDVATAGYYQLHWKGDVNNAVYRVLESSTPLFDDSRMIYQGPDLARVMSGKPNGKYYYRVVELQDGNPVSVSNTLSVKVQLHSLTKALSFFAIGAVVFLATLFLVLKGNKITDSRDV